jgi:hypothetical protein
VLHANAALPLASVFVWLVWWSRKAGRWRTPRAFRRRLEDRRSVGRPVPERGAGRHGGWLQSPHASPGQTSQSTTTKRIISLRLRKRWGAVRLAAETGVAPSTVVAVLRRCQISRLAHLNRIERPVVRYEHPAPGDLLHADVKTLGNIPEGVAGASSAGNRARPTATATAARPAAATTPR